MERAEKKMGYGIWKMENVKCPAKRNQPLAEKMENVKCPHEADHPKVEIKSEAGEAEMWGN